MWWWCWKTRNNRNVEKVKSDEGKLKFFLVVERASLSAMDNDSGRK